MVQAAAGSLGIKIHIPAPFEFPSGDVPLSWVLTNSEQNEIGSQWKAVEGQRSCTIQQVKEFVSGQAMRQCER